MEVAHFGPLLQNELIQSKTFPINNFYLKVQFFRYESAISGNFVALTDSEPTC